MVKEVFKLKLAGQNAIVTGGGSGIGKAIAQRFSVEGANVAILDLNESGLNSVASEVGMSGGRALKYKCDVTNAKEVQMVFSDISNSFGGIDILVNSAGIEIVAEVEEMDEADWDRQIDVNLKSMFLCSKYAVPLMRKKSGGSVVNISSVLGVVVAPKHSAYCASKGAVLQFTKALGFDHAKDQIRVNCILPGPIDTPLYRNTIAAYGDAEAAHLQQVRAVPLHRIGTPDDVAKAAVFLCSEDASFITCASLVVDGGFTASNITM